MIKSGDIFEITTSKGKAYFQSVEKNKLMGWVIRVLPGTYPAEVPELTSLVKVETNFWIYFPVGTAVRRKAIRKVGTFDIPPHAQKTPLFRSGAIDPRTRKVATWWLWDGEKSQMVGEITEEQRKLPIKAIWNDTLLIQRIEEGWLPENDPR